MTDGGLAQLTGWTALRVLELKGTKVTKAGVEKLAAALPLPQAQLPYLFAPDFGRDTVEELSRRLEAQLSQLPA